jgi:hypothetical protein
MYDNVFKGDKIMKAIDRIVRHEIAKAEAYLRVSVIKEDVSVIDRIVQRVNPTLRYKVQKRITEMRKATGLTSNVMDWVRAYPER